MGIVSWTECGEASLALCTLPLKRVAVFRRAVSESSETGGGKSFLLCLTQCSIESAGRSGVGLFPCRARRAGLAGAGVRAWRVVVGE